MVVCSRRRFAGAVTESKLPFSGSVERVKHTAEQYQPDFAAGAASIYLKMTRKSTAEPRSALTFSALPFEHPATLYIQQQLGPSHLAQHLCSPLLWLLAASYSVALLPTPPKAVLEP